MKPSLSKGTLQERLDLRSAAHGDMALLQKASRLSVQPVTPDEWSRVLKMAGARVKLG